MAGAFLAIVSGCGHPKSRSTNSAALLQLQAGDYLSSAYIAELTRTRSALAAGETGTLTSVSVTRTGSKISIIPGFNFHEAGEEFMVAEDGSISVDPNVTHTRKVSAEALNDHTLKFGYEDIPPASFALVKDEYAYVARIMIVGKYHDARGRIYEFADDGRAIFPERTFKYDIGLDHVLNPYDYYTESGKTWAFKRNNKELQIFATADTDDGFEQITSAKPSLVLQEQ